LSQRNAHDLRANYLWRLAHALRRRGKPADALRLAEESRQLFRRLVAEAPEDMELGFGLYRSWEQIGKAHVALGRPDEALAAWLQGVEVMRRVVERAPSEPIYRRTLAARYLNLSRHLRGEGRLADAAGWLLEKEKLMPADTDNLRELSHEFKQLAAAVGQGRNNLSPAEQAQRERYLEQAKRLADAAAARP
jgi:tetratricopeptide (TPR) repeat protein